MPATTDPNLIGAINELLDAIGADRVTAADNDGAAGVTLEARAQAAIEQAARQVQRFNPTGINMIPGKAILSDANGVIDLSVAGNGSITTAFGVYGEGALAYRPLSLSGTQVRDDASGSTNGWGNAQTYRATLLVEVAFASMPPMEREVALAMARVHFYLREKPDGSSAALSLFLAQLDQAQRSPARPAMIAVPQPMGAGPLTASPPQPGSARA